MLRFTGRSARFKKTALPRDPARYFRNLSRYIQSKLPSTKEEVNVPKYSTVTEFDFLKRTSELTDFNEHFYKLEISHFNMAKWLTPIFCPSGEV